MVSAPFVSRGHSIRREFKTIVGSQIDKSVPIKMTLANWARKVDYDSKIPGQPTCSADSRM